MKDISGRCVILGVMGGVSAYKSCEIARGLVKRGAHVTACLTDAAQQFVTPLLFESLTRSACLTDPAPRIGQSPDAPFPHIRPAERCDLLIVAPMTADGMFKFAHGAGLDLLSTLVLSIRAPKIGCPAMNTQMWESPAVQRNLQILIDDGWNIIGPDSGEMACGHVGKGRMSEPDAILEQAMELLP